MSVYYESALANAKRLECKVEIARLRAQRDRLLEACEQGAKTLKVALAAIDGACDIPKERRTQSQTIVLMEQAIAAAKEDK